MGDIESGEEEICYLNRIVPPKYDSFSQCPMTHMQSRGLSIGVRLRRGHSRQPTKVKETRERSICK